MVSQVNPIYPVYGNPTTITVRQNFGFTKAEIEALQNLANNSDQGPWLPLVGGNLSGQVRSTMAGGSSFIYNSGAAPTIEFNTTGATAGTGVILGRRNSITRWGINLGNSGSESANHFSIENFNDAGVSQGTPFIISRSSGQVIINNSASFGSQLAPSVTDLSKHIMLYSSNFGFNVTSGALNYNVPGGSNHVFYIAGAIKVAVGNTAITSAVGLDLGSAVAASPTDNTRHISLYGGTYGLNVTGSRLNINAGSTANIVDVIGGVDKLTVNNTAVIATVPITLPADPTAPLQSSTKQYVDNLVTRSGGPWLPLVGGSLSGGLGFGGVLAASSTNLTRHISLHTDGYGFNVTTGRLNLVGIGTIAGVVGGIDRFLLDAGEATFGANTGASFVTVNGPSGEYRAVMFKTARVNRWGLLINPASTESTGNAGSNLELNSYADNGALVTNVWSVNRATGITTYTNGISFGTNVGATVVDTSKHIVLHTNGYGFSVTSGRLNILASTGAAIVSNIGGTDRLTVSFTAVTSQIPIVLPSDPTTALQAATKQYVDATITRAGGPFLPLIGGTVTGATTFSAAGTALTVTNNATVGGTLTAAVGSVTGALTAGSGTINGNTIIAVHPTATTAQLYLRPASSPGTNGMESKLRFGGTFASGTDYGPRFIASIRAGMVSAWGTEYLDIWTGTTTNDISSDVNQARIARFQNAGITFDKQATFSANVIVTNIRAPGATSLSLGNVTSGEVLRLNDLAGARTSRADISYSAGSNTWFIGAAGTTSNLSLITPGPSVILFNSNSATQFRVNGVASAVNYLQVSGSIVATAPLLEALGSDTNIGIRLTPKGTGNVVVTNNTISVARDPTSNLELATKQYVDFNIDTSGGQFLPLTGGTLLGMLELPATVPTLGTHATNKTYVDTKAGNYLPLTGGTITGGLTVTGNLVTNGLVFFNGGNVQIKTTTNTRISLFATAAPTDAKTVDMFLDGGGNFNMQFVNDAFNSGTGFFGVTRSGQATTGLTLTAPVIGLNGSVNTGFLYPSGATVTTGFAIYADATYRYIRFTTDGWRLLFNASTGNLTFDNPAGTNMHVFYGNGDLWARGSITANLDIVGVRNISTNGAIYPSNALLSGGFALYADASDINIRFTLDNWRLFFQRSTGLLGYWNSAGQILWQCDPTGNMWAKASISCAVNLHADNNVTGVGRVQGNNGIMSGNGCFYVAYNDAYRLQRQSDGAWIFYENEQWNAAIRASGSFEARLNLHCQGVGVIYGNIGSNGFNNRWTGANLYIRVDNAVEIGVQPLSDIRVKSEVAPSTFDCLAAVMATPLFQFKYRQAQQPARLFDSEDVGELIPVGFVAQTQHEIWPSSVVKGDDEVGKGVVGATQLWSMNHNTLCAALVGSIQQQQAMIDKLVARIEQLEATIH